MRTDDINLITNAVNSLLNVIRNLPFEGSIEDKRLLQILYLDKYIKTNVDYETGVLEIDEAIMVNNLDYAELLKQKYSYAFDEVGIVKERKSSSVGITEFASDVLRRLGVQCNIVKGHILINSFNGLKYYPHQWNEIKLNNIWYCYDFTFNLISHNWKNTEYKDALKFIKMPITPVDYSFVSRPSKNIKIGGYTNPKRGPILRDLTLLSDDFSKYCTMDKSKLLNAYMNVELIYKNMNR